MSTQLKRMDIILALGNVTLMLLDFLPQLLELMMNFLVQLVSLACATVLMKKLLKATAMQSSMQLAKFDLRLVMCNELIIYRYSFCGQSTERQLEQ